MFLRPRSWLPARIIELYDAHRFEAATIWGQMRQRPYTGTGLEYLQAARLRKKDTTERATINGIKASTRNSKETMAVARAAI
jgi:hypothetical protein